MTIDEAYEKGFSILDVYVAPYDILPVVNKHITQPFEDWARGVGIKNIPKFVQAMKLETLLQFGVNRQTGQTYLLTARTPCEENNNET